MPFALSTLISGRPRSRRKLYFPPGGHTRDRHSNIPLDRLHISLSDPVLVAAEQRLSNGGPGETQCRPPININHHAGTITISEPRHIVLHLGGGYLLPSSSACAPLAEGANPVKTRADTQETSLQHGSATGFRGATAPDRSLLDPSYDPCDISEVMTIVTTISGSPGNLGGSENSRPGFDLGPLASEMFKEEMYVRGYLRRPASRPSNVEGKPRANLTLMGRKILGQRQGLAEVGESQRAEQDAPQTPGRFDAHIPENQPPASVASVTLRIVHADSFESPGTDANTSTANTSTVDTFDLHEFSYITAFTTPPSSPSIILDVEMLKKGVGHDNSKHAV